MSVPILAAAPMIVMDECDHVATVFQFVKSEMSCMVSYGGSSAA
ncbi:hypothetical protein [Paenibacillus taiwanensis]|nr:hypothetical protein [Paenibacillus taiwanensis]